MSWPLSNKHWRKRRPKHPNWQRQYHRYSIGDLRPPVKGDMRVVRGGTCLGWKKILFRCAHRRGNDPAVVNILYTGIRCAADVPVPSEIKLAQP